MWKPRLIYDWFLNFSRTHPEWMKQWKLNNQDKNIWNPLDRTSERERKPTDHFGKVPNQDWGPFKKIPNVRNIKVHLGIKNKLLALFGIEAKFSPTFSYEAHQNLGMNKYMNYQIYRLKQAAKEDPKLYFKIVNNLLRYSKVLFVIGLNHVEPKWHREMPQWKVYKLWKEYNRIAQSKKWNVQHHRLYIDKANGKKRPLGVPSMVWRIYLHQVANFLSLYLEERKFFNESQHGFRTRLGTKTAWQEILKWVIKADWIYEFDLERCFPNIHVKGVSKAMRKAKIPKGWVNKLEYLNMVPVNNPNQLRQDTKEANEWNKWMEQCRKEKEESDERMKTNERNTFYQIANSALSKDPEAKTLDYLQVLSSLEGSGKLKVSKEWLGADIEWWEPSPEADLGISEMFYGMDPAEAEPLYKELFKGTDGDPERGLPQGLPTSPLLTIASLQENFIKESPWNVIMYADDGLLYGRGQPPREEELITKLNSERYGITINKEKSGFAKLPGGPIDLKFLGMRLKDDILSAETREGATLQYDKHNLIDIYDMLDNWGIVYKFGTPSVECPREPAEDHEHMEQEPHFYMYQAWSRYNNRNSWTKLASSRLFGLIQSRLFQNGWNVPIAQCFDLTYKPRSWVDLHPNPDLNVFNSTSYACNSLLQALSKLPKPGRGKVTQGK